MSDNFKTNDGRAVRLGRELGRGGQGTVYAVEGQPDICAKVYAPKAIDADLQNKLRAMVAAPPKDPALESMRHHSIAWPTRLLYRDGTGAASFAGFVMPMIADRDFKKAISRFHPGSRGKESGWEFTWQHSYHAAWNISSAVAAIHDKGYCIGDINESNILVAGNTLATLIDCDSFQVRESGTGRTFRCGVGKGEYTAPELGGKPYAEVDRTPETDYFGLAVLLFQFLMEGCHPYQSRGQLVEDAPSTEKKISLGYFPYSHAGKPRGVDPPAYAPPFDILHPDIQRMFVRAFVEGHAKPSARPSSKEWFECLRGLRKHIVGCKANRRHWYFSQLGACPWCRLNQEKGKDPFPAPGKEPAKAPVPVLATTRTAPPRSIKPVLKVSSALFHHRVFVPGVMIHDVLTVENAGSGELTGRLNSNRDWLRLSETRLDAKKRSQDIGLTIDTNGLATKFGHRARVDIDTNGGRATVTVQLGEAGLTISDVFSSLFPGLPSPSSAGSRSVPNDRQRHLPFLGGIAALMIILGVIALLFLKVVGFFFS